MDEDDDDGGGGYDGRSNDIYQLVRMNDEKCICAIGWWKMLLLNVIVIKTSGLKQRHSSKLNMSRKKGMRSPG